MKLKPPPHAFTKGPVRRDPPTSEDLTRGLQRSPPTQSPSHLPPNRLSPLPVSAQRQNGSPASYKPMPHPPWQKPYPPDKPQRGPGDPDSDPLPENGSIERRLIDAQIASIVALAGSSKLPNFVKAIIHPNKIWGYALRTDHDEGKSKANLFGLMGFICLSLEERDYAREDWRKSGQLLIAQIRHGISTNTILEASPARHGVTLTVYLPIEGPNGRREDLRTVWMYGYKEKDGVGYLSARPNLTSIYKDEKRKSKGARKKGLVQ